VLFAGRIENLAPALSPDGANPEYPWPHADPHASPAEYDFELWRELSETDAGRKFLTFIENVFRIMDQLL
jgi:hypothetical protein